MSETVSERLTAIKGKVARAERRAGRPAGSVSLIAVSKTFPAEAAAEVIDAGHRIFGENRVQEAKAKWPALQEAHPDVDLHLIGPLQSNKAKEAVALFDAIHTIDRDKIAKAVATEMGRQGRALKLFVQINTGEEEQKAGIPPRDAVAFLERCRSEHGLAIEGLMCIPPVDEAPGPHFALLRKLAQEAGVGGLSMGMSSDFETAVEFGATHVRVGSALFGERPPIGE
ncbi:YggS family pyridoxal phosphate-dependent enzyme [Amorphus orientalis]|uniref:Pyridoxal phosphate homeostasis protein n=1 Tax=Amorphus orientalis TaxID=649198 RepID=A0AAE3VKI3_9HYPH|nr:YggS family pyridoxal phosphate-dependent enzyme [Amorphus orientalis]MDQ0313741.1 pyridoxal phosphate enzyme (YggS family) [Amorphus orientalis]